MVIPVIDIQKTSIRLKEIRENREIKISELQTLFNMTNPQSIYNWENPAKKNLPRIDNLVILAKFYDVKIDDLIILKDMNADEISISDMNSNYCVSEEVFMFIKENASESIKNALYQYYSIY